MRFIQFNNTLNCNKAKYISVRVIILLCSTLIILLLNCCLCVCIFRQVFVGEIPVVYEFAFLGLSPPLSCVMVLSAYHIPNVLNKQDSHQLHQSWNLMLHKTTDDRVKLHIHHN